MKTCDVIVYDAFNSYLVETENGVLCERQAAAQSAVRMKCQVITSDLSLCDRTAS